MITVKELEERKQRGLVLSRAILDYVTHLNANSEYPLKKGEFLQLLSVDAEGEFIEVYTQPLGAQSPWNGEDVQRLRNTKTFFKFTEEELNKFLNENSTTAETIVLGEVSQ